MQRRQAFEFAVRPDGRQERLMRRFAGSTRFVFNKALALQMERHTQGERNLSYAQLRKRLTQWRANPETAWLVLAPVHPLQQSLRDLDRAYKNFFLKRANVPRFKKRGRKDAFRYPDPKQVKLDQANGRPFLPTLGWLRYRKSRDVLGAVKNVTRSRSGEKWYVSIQTEREVEQPIHPGGTVGIDMGVARFATLSDGTFHAPRNAFKRHEAALRKAQRSLSRKKKFSKNWRKAKAKVATIHARMGNARRDDLHEVSTTISKTHAIVYTYKLHVQNMMKSAAGNTHQPGRQVKAKSSLNRAVLDQGWFEFRRQLDDKLTWNGGALKPAPARNTSRTCPTCEHISKDNRTTQARFACVECGFTNHADLVAAINIQRVGHARFACEVSDAERPPAAGTHRSDSRVAIRHA